MWLSGIIVTSALLLPAFAAAQVPGDLAMGAPLGAAWGATYGFPPGKAWPFVARARALGAGFTRVTLYWSQLEPRPGVRRWDDLDAFAGQLRSPDEGILTIASASPWATRTPAWVFPSSPAKDLQAYEAFVRETVLRVKGRVRYVQSDPEPNNPFFWSGSIAEFIVQQKAFYRAVKQADPDALVVLGGCDGLFDPDGRATMPQQVASRAFVDKVVAEAVQSFDVFDLRLYDDPYTVPARVAYVRARIEQAGGHQPVIATEYAGPTFFELRPNRKHDAALQGAGAAEAVRGLMAARDRLPLETRMFLADAAPADAARLRTLQTRDLVVRNLLAFAAGVQKTAFWDLWHDPGDPQSANAMMYGSLRLLAYSPDGEASPTLLGDAFARLASRLGDATRVARLPAGDDAAVFAFLVTRSRGAPLVVAWRKPLDAAHDAVAAPVTLPWRAATAHAVTLQDDAIASSVTGGHVVLTLGSEPVFLD